MWVCEGFVGFWRGRELLKVKSDLERKTNKWPIVKSAKKQSVLDQKILKSQIDIEEIKKAPTKSLTFLILKSHLDRRE